jgi:hypothetical protein
MMTRTMTEPELIAYIGEHLEAIGQDLIEGSGFRADEAASLATRIADEARRVLTEHLGRSLMPELERGLAEILQEVG